MEQELKRIESIVLSCSSNYLEAAHIMHCVLNKIKRRDVAARELELIYNKLRSEQILIEIYNEEIEKLLSKEVVHNALQQNLATFKDAYKQLEESKLLSYEKLQSVCDRINRCSCLLGLKEEKLEEKVFELSEEDCLKSFLLSVKMDTGIYVHLQIALDATFEELHTAILNSFYFDDDHAHVFFFGRPWLDDQTALYADYLEDVPNYSSEFYLGELLEQGKTFTYIFDFGEEWRFQCKVLKLLDEAIDDYKLIKTVGTPRPQYRNWDEEEDEEEEE